MAANAFHGTKISGHEWQNSTLTGAPQPRRNRAVAPDSERARELRRIARIPRPVRRAVHALRSLLRAAIHAHVKVVSMRMLLAGAHHHARGAVEHGGGGATT